MKRIAIERFLTEVVQRSVPILPYDARAAQWHAAERARLTRLGKTPSFSDGQIAAIAVVNQLTLVTNNVSDFALFDELHVVHWRQNAL
jgi:tRNA(fMet)-specific endonuclease VapC